MNDDKPESLLKSALEKIVYFEARSTQLSNDLDQARNELERLKGELASAAQREIELRRVIAGLEVRATRAHSEREEAARVTDALRRERADLIAKMLDASRIHGADADVGDFDLAQFIAQLRQEVLVTRDSRPDAAAQAVLIEPVPASWNEPAPIPSTAVEPRAELVSPKPAPKAADELPAPRPSGVTQVAHELRAQGRLDVSVRDLDALTGAKSFPGRSEETLFGFSVRELSAPDSSARVRAADRLKALAHPAAAPVLAAALHAEQEPSVQVALLGALSSLAKAEAVPVVSPLLTSSSPDVRIAALKALLVLDVAQAGPHLAAATKDPDKAVRRRASLLALGLTGKEALELGAQAVRDSDADVRSLAALVLGASNAESARPLLLEAMRDADVRVRRSASQALSRLLGQDVSSLVNLDDAHRRREVRRIAQLPTLSAEAREARALEARAVAKPPKAVVEGSGRDVVAERSRRAASETSPLSGAQLAPAKKIAVAVLEVEQAPATSEALCGAILGELRSSIRGRQLDDLATNVSASSQETLRAVSALLERGQVVRRGLKYFVA